MSIKINLVGEKYGDLLVLEEANYLERKKGIYWKCLCKCGNIYYQRTDRLRARGGKAKRCEKCRISLLPLADDLTEQKFGKLTVLSLKERKNGLVYWNCKCDCGENKIVQTHHLKDKHTRSCGCIRKLDLVGKIFGNLTVLMLDKSLNRPQSYWRCQCECGKIVTVKGTNLTTNHTKSCGNKSHRIKLTEEERLMLDKSGKIKNRYVLYKKQVMEWRGAVLERDGNMCQLSGRKEKLEVHHLESWNSNR